MRDDLDIWPYLVPVGIWILSFFYRAIVKDVTTTKKESVIGTTNYLNQNPTAEKREEVFFDEVVSQDQEEVKTPLGKDSYRERVAYHRMKKVRPKTPKPLVQKNDEKAGGLEIDWKKAVVFSEILNPRF